MILELLLSSIFKIKELLLNIYHSLLLTMTDKLKSKDRRTLNGFDEQNYFNYLEMLKSIGRKTISFDEMTSINNLYKKLPVTLKNENTLEKTLKLIPSLIQYMYDNYDYKNSKLDYVNDYYLLDDIGKNKKLIKIALEQHGAHIQYLSYMMRNDRELGLISVTQNGSSIQYLSNNLKNDRELCLIAIKQNGHNIQHLSNELRDDKELALIAINQNPKSICRLSKNLKSNSDMILFALKNSVVTFDSLNIKIVDDNEIVFYALRNFLLTQKYLTNDNIKYLLDKQKKYIIIL